MKRISTILLATALTLPSFAQLIGNGFYRVKNAQSNRYASIVDNKADKDMLQTSSADLYAIKLLDDFDNVVSDPGSIIYIEQVESGVNGYILRGQGMDTYKLTGLYLKTHKSYEVEGAYYAYGTKSSMTRYLKETYYSTFKFYHMATVSNRSDISCSWNIIPVTEDNGQFFGLKPEIEIEGKYYTTLYASFAYQLSPGMKAYYVKQTIGEKAEIVEIKDKIIPASTPVIIECNSNKVEDNKLTPQSTSTAGNFKNILKGVYFCNVFEYKGVEKRNNPNWNTTDYNSSTMRILGNVNGKLGFVKSESLKYIPANKAYLTVSATNTSDKIELVDATTYREYASEYTGITDVTSDQKNSKNNIYTLTGNKVNSTENLPAGVYVIDGKKTIIRK